MTSSRRWRTCCVCCCVGSEESGGWRETEVACSLQGQRSTSTGGILAEFTTPCSRHRIVPVSFSPPRPRRSSPNSKKKKKHPAFNNPSLHYGNPLISRIVGISGKRLLKLVRLITSWGLKGVPTHRSESTSIQGAPLAP